MDLAPLAFRQFNARFLARGEQTQTLEGPAFVTHVLIAFDDDVTARSPAYQLVKQQRRHVAEAMITIVDGLPPVQ